MRVRPRIVIDTNVLLAALRSRSGASYRLMSRFGNEQFVVCISVPLVLECEAVALRERWPGKPGRKSIGAIIDYLCLVAEAVQPPYLWRPMAKDRVSINQFVTSAVAEKISALDTVDYIQQRARRAARGKFLRAMARIPRAKPAGADER